jgi:hypothetical protein
MPKLGTESDAPAASLQKQHERQVLRCDAEPSVWAFH